MQHEFWHTRWQENRIGFHQFSPTPLLVNYFGQLNMPVNSRVFVPLSGKTLDISWLLQQGYRVVAIELSQIAVTALIEQLAEDFAMDFSSNEKNQLIHYHHPQIDIYVGDFFDLTAQQLGRVDLIYDRAALIALPAPMRRDYAQHLMQITHQAPQLLISYEYDADSHSGPPFSLSTTEIESLYGQAYKITLLKLEWVDATANKGDHPRNMLWQLNTKSS